uniref:Uncharacterized protein n=1 Tax=Meloidogyne enterolobii TaxID=390850 RepID=A0A6V7TK32_MELEN|nr:unnamed protein product [Meloidogyne enterolobii]
MASVSFFVRFVAILLLVVSIVYCDLVGHGKHELVNGKIVKLRGNTKIAEKPEDLELYKNMPGSCDVEMDKDGHIILWYLKHSSTTKEGCSIDFVVADPTVIENEHDLPLHFGIQHNKELTDCLAFYSYNKIFYKTVNYSDIALNLLSFSFSLKNGEFDGVKRGYPERHKNYCGDVLKCYNKGGKCLDVADYTVGWARTLKYIRSIIHPIGETELELVEASCSPITEHKHEAVVFYYFDGMGFRFFTESPKTYFCFKQENVRKPEKWKITDEDYTDTLYNHLFTFHILPTTSMQMSMQNIWIKCNEDADKENCNENAAFQQCDKMFVKFPRYLFNMLVPDNSVKQTTTEETTTMATCPPCVTDCPTVGFPNAVTNIIQSGNSTKIVEIKPQNGSSLPGVPSTSKPSSPANDCYNEETKKDSKKTLQITLVIVGSIILLLMFTALLICLFVSKSK